MRFLIDPAIRYLEQRASFRTARQEVVAANLANVETPGYTAREVSFDSYLAKAESGNGVTLAKTNRLHLDGPGGTGPAPVAADRETDPARVDGNNVVLEKEMAKMAENTIGYLTTVTLLSRKLRGIRYAIDEASRQ
ncbi:MAG: flagellar basal body rod protein FlgB [Deltaproteobacteria bacterium]